MASLNLSTNGASISKSYNSVVNAPATSGPAASSPTYGQWALFAVSAPLVNAFQQDAGGKESVLKVQSTGGELSYGEPKPRVAAKNVAEGELVDLIDEFSDGRIQFAYIKVKDPNTGLAKNALVAWCGEGVPERTKGYFTSHLAAVSKLLHVGHLAMSWTRYGRG
jgi:drebrin-like protein